MLRLDEADFTFTNIRLFSFSVSAILLFLNGVMIVLSGISSFSCVEKEEYRVNGRTFYSLFKSFTFYWAIYWCCSLYLCAKDLLLLFFIYSCRVNLWASKANWFFLYSLIFYSFFKCVWYILANIWGTIFVGRLQWRQVYAFSFPSLLLVILIIWLYAKLF